MKSKAPAPIAPSPGMEKRTRGRLRPPEFSTTWRRPKQAAALHAFRCWEHFARPSCGNSLPRLRQAAGSCPAPGPRGLAAGGPEPSESLANEHPHREPRPKKDAPSSHNAFLRLEGPIARGVRGGRTAPSAFARPRQTPPCGRRANCPVIGRGAGRHGQSCEGRGFSPRAPAAGAQRAVLSAGGEVFFQCGYSTTPPPSVKSTRSALSCGCSPEDRRPRVLRRRDRAHRLQLRKSKVINPEILIEYVLCFMLYSKCLRTRCE